jgi:hypothetical protein
LFNNFKFYDNTEEISKNDVFEDFCDSNGIIVDFL